MKYHNITLNHLKTFIVVARDGSFNQAAEKLSRTQPAVTLSIKQLEAYLNLNLFERTTRSVTLTKDGKNFLPIANRLVLDFDIAITDMAGVSECRSGHVSIAVVASIATNILPKIIKAFTLKHPNISIHLYDDNSKGVQQRVESNEVDFGIASLWHANKKLDFLPFLSDAYVMVCNKDHPLAKNVSISGWQQLVGYDFIGSGLTHTLKMQKYIGSPKYEFSNTTTLIAMLKANIGITVLPSLAIPDDPDLVFFPLANPTEKRNICLITRQKTIQSPAARAMIQILWQETPKLIEENKFKDNIQCLFEKNIL
jgi:LysR family carnitine catabolism transcriptional activator